MLKFRPRDHIAQSDRHHGAEDTYMLDPADSPDCELLQSLYRAGYTVGVMLQHDTDTEAPWECECGHGEVQHFRGARWDDAMPPGWVDITPPNEPGTWAYDFGGAMQKAMRENWGVDKEQFAQAARAHKARTGKRLSKAQAAVRADMERMRAYLAGEWAYFGVCVVIRDPYTGEAVAGDSLLGVEWGHSGPDDLDGYVCEVAGDCLYNAAHAVGMLPAQRSAAWRAALTEARERKACAARGILTTN